MFLIGKKKYLFPVLFLVLVGCANPYKDNYHNLTGQWSSGEVARLLPKEGPAKLVVSKNMQEDFIKMSENGYLLIGESKFREQKINEDFARAQADIIGASVVLVDNDFVGTETKSVPMSEWIPPRSEIYTERSYYNRGDIPGPLTGDRVVMMTVQGEYRTKYVPQSVDYYDYTATYWAKSKPPIFGVLVQPISEYDRKVIQSNKGAVVRAVIKGSPAYNSDILVDDIIVKLNDEYASDPDVFFDLVIKNKGKSVNVEFIREGETKIAQLKLNDEN